MGLRRDVVAADEGMWSPPILGRPLGIADAPSAGLICAVAAMLWMRASIVVALMTVVGTAAVLVSFIGNGSEEGNGCETEREISENPFRNCRPSPPHTVPTATLRSAPSNAIPATMLRMMASIVVALMTVVGTAVVLVCVIGNGF